MTDKPLSRRERLIANGWCAKCGQVRPLEGRKHCGACLDTQKARQKDYHHRKVTGGPINPVGRPPINITPHKPAHPAHRPFMRQPSPEQYFPEDYDESRQRYREEPLTRDPHYKPINVPILEPGDIDSNDDDPEDYYRDAAADTPSETTTTIPIDEAEELDREAKAAAEAYANYERPEPDPIDLGLVEYTPPTGPIIDI